MMKKSTKFVMAVAALSMTAGSVFAQNRKCNIQLTRIVSPAENFLVPRQGDPAIPELTFMLKNNGPNNMVTGDTIVYRHSLHIDAQVSLAVLAAPLNSGDSVLISTGMTFYSTVTGSADAEMDFCVELFDINTAGISVNGTPVLVTYDDTDTSAASNARCNAIKLKGEPVSIFELNNVTKEELSLYPNPANGEVNFNLNLDKTENVVVTVKDIAGREVLRNNFGKVQAGNAAPFKLNVANLNAGMYFVELNAGERKAVGKLTVSH
jgi:hypothetical protein